METLGFDAVDSGGTTLSAVSFSWKTDLVGLFGLPLLLLTSMLFRLVSLPFSCSFSGRNRTKTCTRSSDFIVVVFCSSDGIFVAGFF